MHRRSLPVVACLLAAVSIGHGVDVAPQRVLAAQQVRQSGTVDADVEVEVYNIAGSVRVRGWDRDEVQVEGTLGEGVDRLSFENDRNGVEIRIIVPRSRRRDPGRQVGDSDLDIMVPHGASLSIETLAATITVQDVDGAVNLESSVGDVVYGGGSRAIEVTTTGDIEVASTADRTDIDVEGVAGSVVVQLVGGRVRASTLTGSLRVLGGRIDDGRFESVSGDLYFEGRLGAGADVDFENFNGNIELLLDADTSADFDVSTYSGTIETEFGFEGLRRDAFSPEQEAEFTLGGGDAAVAIETFSGTVRVRRR